MDKLYIHTVEVHNTRSAKIVVPIILDFIPAASVLDVGCGTGTWLKVLNEDFGLSDLVGLDGSYVDENQLVMEKTFFKAIDLRNSFDLKRRFDLVLCLEVAEHLPEASAEDLVASLCNHGDNIVFSAAIPGQGGQNHLNEQWASYWEAHFRKRNYRKFDIIRPRIWDNENVDVWYRQNIFLFTRGDAMVPDSGIEIFVEIHSALWKMKIDTIAALREEIDGFDKGYAGIRRSFSALLNAIIRKLLKFLRTHEPKIPRQR